MSLVCTNKCKNLSQNHYIKDKVIPEKINFIFKNIWSTIMPFIGESLTILQDKTSENLYDVKIIQQPYACLLQNATKTHFKGRIYDIYRMIIGDYSKSTPNYIQKLNPVSANYYNQRIKERELEAKKGKSINFNHNYNEPIIEQYTQKKTPGPNQYNPKFDTVMRRSYNQPFYQSKRKLAGENINSNNKTPSSADYNFNFDGKIQFNPQKATSFPRTGRIYIDSRKDYPGVGTYNSSKLIEMNRSKGILFSRSDARKSMEIKTPGVGTYNTNRSLSQYNQHKFNNSKRFTNKIVTTPGVGNYNVEKAIRFTSDIGTKYDNKYGVIGKSGLTQNKQFYGSLGSPAPGSYNVQGYFDQLSKNKIKDSIVHRRHGKKPNNIIV
ncbi:hypothetical protein PPERSA_06018 [Pseudocohnilembus persalinus]|uniref:Sperm-tail PG-rich repeat n=1 Tax=Pseudocohnilembus persalinus TaxID=266149 RepID=A0A0V0QQH8_PSEPJ|nr:hypothetical protein PPERSA_06018 [Pseudocohnilembus persalinus]|eukprot:KRX04465.1 hypothetical protein PPERSA_06018 [Pseudocohnilembus persalinus]